MNLDTLSGWLDQFSALHQRAKDGVLDTAEHGEYLRARDELAEAMLVAQKMEPYPGQHMRRTLRVAQALPVRLQLPALCFTAVTLDLSMGGFSTLAPDAPETGMQVGFHLKLGRGHEPVAGSGKVVNVNPQKGSVRVGVMFEEIASSDRQRIEHLIVDAILKQFRR